MGTIIVTYWIHPAHPEHGLEMIDEGSRFHCDGCKMDGVGKRYTCKQRDFCLHPCMFAENKITIKGRTYSFFDNPRLIKSNRKKAGCTKCGRSCDACSKTILGFVYHCPRHDEDFHPACAQLLDSKRYTQDFTLKREVVSKCAECNRKLPEGAENRIPGLSYVNEDEGLKFHFYCAMELAMERYISKKISETRSAMKLHSSSESNNYLSELVKETHSSLSESDEVLSSASIGTEVVLENNSSKKISKNKRKKTSKTKKCLSILKLFVSATVSILLGDPTTIIASTVVQLVSEALSKASG